MNGAATRLQYSIEYGLPALALLVLYSPEGPCLQE